MPDWQLWLPSAAQHHERVSSCILLAWEKNPNSKFEVRILLNAYCFCTIVKSENHKLNHCNSGTLSISKLLALTGISFIPKKGTTPLLQQENLFQQKLSHLSFSHPPCPYLFPSLFQVSDRTPLSSVSQASTQTSSSSTRTYVWFASLHPQERKEEGKGAASFAFPSQ